MLGFQTFSDKVVKKMGCDVLISALSIVCARRKIKGISYAGKLQLIRWGVNPKLLFFFSSRLSARTVLLSQRTVIRSSVSNPIRKEDETGISTCWELNLSHSISYNSEEIRRNVRNMEFKWCGRHDLLHRCLTTSLYHHYKA